MGNKRRLLKRLPKRQLKKLQEEKMNNCRRNGAVRNTVQFSETGQNEDEVLTKRLSLAITRMNSEYTDPNVINNYHRQKEKETDNNDDVITSYAKNEDNAPESTLKPQATAKVRPQTRSKIHNDINLYDAAERVIIDKVYFFEKL